MRLGVALLAAGGVALSAGWRGARSDPVVRRASLVLRDWPRGGAPVRVALVADIHLCGAATRRERLARINRLLR